MPGKFKVTYTIYFKAFDLATAQRFAPMFCNRLTHALRKLNGGWVTDDVSVAVPAGAAQPATSDEHAKALKYEPPKECYADLSRQAIDHIAGAWED